MENLHVDLLVVGEALAEIGLTVNDFLPAGLVVKVMERFDLREYSTHRVDLLLLSSRDQAQSIDYIDQCRALRPECAIAVVLSNPIADALWFLRPGVYALLNGEKSLTEFMLVKETVARQRLHVDHSIAQPLAVRQIKRLLLPFECLSSREFDVFCMLADGCSLQQIADFLQISRKTVSNCQTQIKIKLGLETKPDMRQFAKTHGLISDKQV